MKPIFVFGSNMNGHHAGGAAYYACQNLGAEWGQPIGLQGDSYAIPTMGHDMAPLSVEAIADHVNEFLNFAADHSEYSFLVTAIGCGIAGLNPADIAPLFAGATENVFLSEKLIAALC